MVPDNSRFANPDVRQVSAVAAIDHNQKYRLAYVMDGGLRWVL